MARSGPQRPTLPDDGIVWQPSYQAKRRRNPIYARAAMAAQFQKELAAARAQVAAATIAYYQLAEARDIIVHQAEVIKQHELTIEAWERVIRPHMVDVAKLPMPTPKSRRRSGPRRRVLAA